MQHAELLKTATSLAGLTRLMPVGADGKNKARGLANLTLVEAGERTRAKITQGEAEGIRMDLGPASLRSTDTGEEMIVGFEFSEQAQKRAEIRRTLLDAANDLGAFELWQRTMMNGAGEKKSNGTRRRFVRVTADAGELEGEIRAVEVTDTNPRTGVVALLVEVMTDPVFVSPSPKHDFEKDGDDLAQMPVISLAEYTLLLTTIAYVDSTGTATGMFGPRLKNMSADTELAAKQYIQSHGSDEHARELLVEAGWTVEQRGDGDGALKIYKPGSDQQRKDGLLYPSGRLVAFSSAGMLPTAGSIGVFEIRALLFHDGDAEATSASLRDLGIIRPLGFGAQHQPHILVADDRYVSEISDEIVDVMVTATSNSRKCQAPMVMRRTDPTGELRLDLIIPHPTQPSEIITKKTSITPYIHMMARLDKAQSKDEDTGEITHTAEHNPPRAIEESARNALLASNRVALVRTESSEPVIMADGSILAKAGYHADHQAYLRENVESEYWDRYRDAVVENPTAKDAQEAFDYILKEVIPDFPFLSDGDRVAWISYLLTAVAPHMAETRPVFAILAPDANSGKSKLFSIPMIIARGSAQYTTLSPFKSKDENNEKVLAAGQMMDARFVGNDNMDSDCTVTSTLITRISTQEDGTAGVRLLGGNSWSWLVGLTFAFAGNRIHWDDEVQRRVIPVRIEHKGGDPKLRKGFHHKELIKWVKSHRPELLAAAHTILAAGIQARVELEELPFEHKSFETWSKVVVGALNQIEITGQNAAKVLAASLKDFNSSESTNTHEWDEAVEFLAHHTAEKALEASKIRELFWGNPNDRITIPGRIEKDFDRANVGEIDIPEELIAVGMRQVRGQARALGDALEKMARRQITVGDRIYRILDIYPGGAGTRSKKSRQWKVEVCDLEGNAITLPGPAVKVIVPKKKNGKF